ncbi:MAG: hypothetical protein GQ565_10160 [Candidatus Aegiribacteria sp.]|nr:hypothetical protein [Candidatus Aegiribacteria sp.]
MSTAKRFLAALDGKPGTGDKIGMKKPRRRKKSAHYTVPLLLLAGVILLLILGVDESTAPMDDTYIHLVYGRSLFTSAPLCFNGAEPSSGFTSPLWLLPSALASLAGTALAPTVLMILSLLAAGSALLILPPFTGILLLMTGPFFFHASSGMETALSCLAVVAVWRCVRDGTGVKVSSFILMGAFLVRPELAVLAIPLVLSMKERTPGNILRLMAPSLIIGLLWMLWNIHTIGLPLPSTFYAKQPVSWLTSAGAGLPGLLKGLLVTSPLLLFAAAVSITELLRSKGKKRPEVSMALVPLLLFALSLCVQPNSFFQMRYYVPALTAAVLATGHWLGGLRRRRLNVFILAVSMLPGLYIFAGRRVDASYDVYSIDVRPAQYLSSVASPAQTVAAADIGAVKWITDMEILDLDGLVTAERLPGSSKEGWQWISDRSDYLLAFPGQYSGLLAEAGDSLEFLIGFRSDRNVICGSDSVALWRIN